MNKRQRLKKVKIQLKKNLDPGKVALITFPMNDKNLDVDAALQFMASMVKQFPQINWLAMPNSMSLRTGDKEVIQAYIDKCQEILNEMSE